MSKGKILIVEDEATTRALLVSELGKAGYQVFQAEDGATGYKIAKAMKLDLIISDFLIPKMDGNELMKKIRESEFGKNLPFIILSARTQMQDYFETVHTVRFIAKPFKMEDVLAGVEEILG